jgi:lipopolysaccharide transport system ATP-binding protein
MPREPEFNHHPVTMRTLEILNNETAVYEVGSNIKACLTCFGNMLVKNTFLRVIIKTVEGTPVTMQTSDQGLRLEKEREEQLFFEIDVSRLVPGRYTLSLVIYEVNEFGGDINLDVLRDIYCFEIVQTKGFNNNMIWHPRYWGYFYNKPLQIGR